MDPHSADDDLHDEALSDEIRLLGEVVLAVSGVARHLTEAEVDRLLHVLPSPPDQQAGGGRDPSEGSAP